MTQFDLPLFLGVETGYNDQGLTFSEETLSLKKPNADGFSIIYLSKIILEEASTIKALYPYFDRYPVIGGYGTVWSGRDEGKGLVAELVAKQWAKQEFRPPILWNTNRIYDKKLVKLQNPKYNIQGLNWDREKIASRFPLKPEYQVNDAVSFLRGHLGPDGSDYSLKGSRRAINSLRTQQRMIFDPEGDGLFLAYGVYFAARGNVYHIHEDFSRRPEIVFKADPLPPAIEAAAKILVKAGHKKDKLEALIALAGTYPQNADIQFLTADEALTQKKMDLWARYAGKAYALAPDNPEYRLHAGLAAWRKKEDSTAVDLLEKLDLTDYYPYHQILRLFALEHLYAEKGAGKQSQFRNQRMALIQKHDAEAYFEKKMKPLFKG